MNFSRHAVAPLLFLIYVLLLTDGLKAQEVDSTFRFYFYNQRYSLFEKLPDTPGEIIMLGNSITNGGNWSELFNNKNIKNRGISGDNTFGILHRLEEVTASQPQKIFLLIGINDLSKDTPMEVILNNYRRIALKIKKQSPHTRLYVQSLMPTSDDFPHFPKAKNKDDKIRAVNQGIREIALELDLVFIDLYPHFLSPQGKLDAAYTNDGLHLMGEGYLLWADILRPYIEEPVEEVEEKVPVKSGDLYYTRKRAMHEAMPAVPGAWVMLGNSITEQGMWNELLPGATILNRGIGGDNLNGMISRLPAILAQKPAKIFLMAGINNILFYNTPPQGVAEGIEEMIVMIREQSPQTQIILQSILPVNDVLDPDKAFLQNKNTLIAESNRLLGLLAQTHGVSYINLHHLFSDDFQRLKENLTTDGIHLSPEGYLLWAQTLRNPIDKE